MSRNWILFVVGLAGCNSPIEDAAGPKAYLTESFFKQQRECEARPAPAHDWSVRSDISVPRHDSTRSRVWKPQRKHLGSTCAIAHVGPYYYEGAESGQPIAYAIDVEVRGTNAPGESPSYRVLFERHFRADEVPTGFENVEIARIVSFDEGTRKVSFNIGGKMVEYRLPAL